MTFQELGLSPALLAALDKAGYQEPLPVQAQAIPPALLGRDVIGRAATGTGKSLAFLLPLLEKVASGQGTQALVLTPTRELAEQLHAELGKLGSKAALVIGGKGLGAQTNALQAGAEIVVATPGRLNEHVAAKTPRLGGVKLVVLDEADRMLDMGFLPQLHEILQHVPKARQTLLFSATLGEPVEQFARKHLREPVRVEIQRTTPERAIQEVFVVNEDEKLALLLALLELHQLSTLVFARTRDRVDRVAKALKRAGHKTAVLHGDKWQQQRKEALEQFRSGAASVLVATDVAARGLDVADIGHVVNYDLPLLPEHYVHRIGRTARLEKTGRASSFASREEQKLLGQLEKYLRRGLQRGEVPRQHEAFRSEIRRRDQPPVEPHQRHGARRDLPEGAAGAHARKPPGK